MSPSRPFHLLSPPSYNPLSTAARFSPPLAHQQHTISSVNPSRCPISKTFPSACDSPFPLPVTCKFPTPPFLSAFSYPNNISGLLGLLNRPKNSPSWELSWGGLPNLFWHISPSTGVCGIYASQLIPPGTYPTLDFHIVFQALSVSA